MDYPQTIPQFLEAARAWVPPSEISEVYYNAAFAASPVEASTEVLRILAGRDDLGEDGLKVLLGAAHIISRPGNQWAGMGSKAAQVLAAHGASG